MLYLSFFLLASWSLKGAVGLVSWNPTELGRLEGASIPVFKWKRRTDVEEMVTLQRKV